MAGGDWQGHPGDLEEALECLPTWQRPIVVGAAEDTYRSHLASTSTDDFVADRRGASLIGGAQVDHRVCLSPHRAVCALCVVRPQETLVKI